MDVKVESLSLTWSPISPRASKSDEEITLRCRLGLQMVKEEVEEAEEEAEEAPERSGDLREIFGRQWLAGSGWCRVVSSLAYCVSGLEVQMPRSRQDHVTALYI